MYAKKKNRELKETNSNLKRINKIDGAKKLELIVFILVVHVYIQGARKNAFF